MMKIPTFVIAIIFLFNGCLKDEPLNTSILTYEPVDIGDGLQLSIPSSEAMDSLKLLDVYKSIENNEDFWSLRSLLVFRNGNFVSEAYFRDPADITQRHLIWSCTKQVMSVLMGIAIDEGVFESLDDPISKYFTHELNDHPDKANITLNNLLTMRSGIDYNNDGVKGQTDKLLRQIPDDMIDFILSRPLINNPGSTFHYNDGDPTLLAALLQKVTGKPADIWAYEVLFSKIGFENYNWIRYRDGITFGGFGIETTPRELAKIALCVANHGKQGDQQLIPSDWITSMTTPKVDTEGAYDFGYYWWIDSSRGIHFMWGHGGQFAFIIPSKNLVIIFTSIPNTQGDYQNNADEVLPLVDKIIDLAN